MSTPHPLARGAPLLALAAAALAAEPAAAQITTRVASASTVAGLTPIRDQFRVDLGGGTTAGANGLFDDGTRQRREINWDGTPDAFASPNPLPANFFNSNSPRGVVFSAAAPAATFQVSSSAASGVPLNFGNIDPSYTAAFAPFSGQRLFTPVGTNVMDVTFFVPGTTTPGVTSGFGVVFADVEVAGATTLLFFDAAGNNIGSFAAPVQNSPTGFSFLGGFLTDGSSRIARVRITTGNAVLAPGTVDNGSTTDLVVMDDFLYGNPIAVPEPGSLGLAAAAVLGWIGARRRRAAQGRA